MNAHPHRRQLGRTRDPWLDSASPTADLTAGPPAVTLPVQVDDDVTSGGCGRMLSIYERPALRHEFRWAALLAWDRSGRPLTGTSTASYADTVGNCRSFCQLDGRRIHVFGEGRAVSQSGWRSSLIVRQGHHRMSMEVTAAIALQTLSAHPPTSPTATPWRKYVCDAGWRALQCPRPSQAPPWSDACGCHLHVSGLRA
ncbi:hypothetical protein CALCODRAFT_288088 [Calocera cornea HHB12733]|uniref:Uncharacterized protein n=1 Tax=Calocera cornea HHB12733 TaxID=1353952 RepID=A0A165FUY1_9BASI|nr:hypothetical protein CALCODRAFT_288088 [Calocera cornea HHB12733]